ncbi:MAG: hypothetical protein ACRD1N_08015 [Terriglobia bacterium]
MTDEDGFRRGGRKRVGVDGWTRASTVAVAAGVPAIAFLTARRAARWARRRRSKDGGDAERVRRRQLNGLGRIAAAEVVDVIEDGLAPLPTRVVVYRYEVAGVAYEAAQEVSSFIPVLPQALAGGAASIKYDPRRPINSIIACEEWSGFAESAFPDGRKA